MDGGSDGSYFFPDTGQQFYTASSGTSHSTPCVSGGCALVRQYFINHSWSPPSPAMTKAYLMNSARYLTGARADDTLWSDSQGMGEMDLGTAFDGTARLLRDQVAGGHVHRQRPDPRLHRRGRQIHQALPRHRRLDRRPGQHDRRRLQQRPGLDRTVGGNTYKGNVFSGAYSITGGRRTR